MKNSFRLLLCGILVSAVYFTACDDDTEDHQHGNHAVINLVAPGVGAEYEPGDTVFIQGTITGEESLHGYDLTIRNPSDQDSVVFASSAHEHDLTLDFDTFWVHNLHHHTDLQLEVKAYLDHDGGFDTLQRAFHCHE